eukprot:2338762-Lingulodinium_polyedra.AAC.1
MVATGPRARGRAAQVDIRACNGPDRGNPAPQCGSGGIEDCRTPTGAEFCTPHATRARNAAASQRHPP